MHRVFVICFFRLLSDSPLYHLNFFNVSSSQHLNAKCPPHNLAWPPLLFFMWTHPTPERNRTLAHSISNPRSLLPYHVFFLTPLGYGLPCYLGYPTQQRIYIPRGGGGLQHEQPSKTPFIAIFLRGWGVQTVWGFQAEPHPSVGDGLSAATMRALRMK